MVDIDKIMDMIDWNQPTDVQSAGRDLAKNVKCINAFLQPGNPGQGKNVWDNCAHILAERSDAELRPYIYELLRWLMDMNWPGAYCIRERLFKFQDELWLIYWLEECIREAALLKEEIWLNTLAVVKQKTDLRLKAKSKIDKI